MLVCSAGITGPNAPTWEYPVDAWRQVIDVNLNGLFYCNRAVVPVMLKNDYGRIVNIASVAGKEGNPNASAYSASKAGVIGLTKSLGKELAKTGIRVNCVTPAAVRTAIFDQMTQQHIDFMLSKIPMGRFGDGRRDRGAGLLARERGVLVLDRRGVRPLGRARDVLTGALACPSGRRAPHGRTASMILPMCCEDSISACAAAASASGNTRWIDRLHLAALEQRPDLLAQRAARSPTLRSSGLARSVEPVTVSRFIMMCRQSTSTRPPCRNAMIDEPAFEREALQVLLDVVAADHVEHDVDAALAGDARDLGDEILRPVVDRVIGAERAAERGLVVAADGRDHRRAESLRELDRGEADAARAAVDQHRSRRAARRPRSNRLFQTVK